MNGEELGYCPRCRKAKTFRRTERSVTEKSGIQIRRIVRVELHCATCGVFVSASETSVDPIIALG
jgi:hypothetical protein